MKIMLVLGLLLLCSCSRKETIAIDGAEVTLSPMNPNGLVATNSLKVVGIISSKDLSEVLMQVSRIPVFDSPPMKIWTVWDENVVAARVAVKRHYVYCTKDSSGEWRVVSVSRVWSDSFEQ